MGKLGYSMHISLDGYIEDATGSFAFSQPDEEVHRFSNAQARDTAGFLFGRRLYELMEDFWTSPERADGDEVEAEFAREYVATPRIIFSDSLESVPDGCRLVRSADSAAEVEKLKRETDGWLSLGGASLAASLVDQIDEFCPIVAPVIVGGGKPYFPSGHRLDLTLIEQRVFEASRWTFARYRVEGSPSEA
jgi:dihydrofolate reductase